MKTKQEVEELKRQWLADGCWDIETTESFEEYHDELLQFRLDTEQKYKQKEQQRVLDKCLRLGITAPLLEYIENLETRIKRLAEQFDNLSLPDASSWSEYQHFKKTHGGE